MTCLIVSTLLSAIILVLSKQKPLRLRHQRHRQSSVPFTPIPTDDHETDESLTAKLTNGRANVQMPPCFRCPLPPCLG